MVPLSGCCAPERMLMSVDLPAPFSPGNAWISPGSTSSPASSSAWTPGNRLRIEVMRRSGSIINLPSQSIKGRRGRLLRLRLRSRPSITASWHKRQSLFYLVQPLGLIEVFARYRNWSEKRYLLFRLLAFTEKPYQRVERPAYLAAGQLLDCGGHAASLNLAQRFGQSVEPDQLHFTEEVARLQSLKCAERHVVVRGDNDVWRLRHARQGRLSHAEALRSIEAGGVFKDDFVFVLGLIQDVVQPLVAIDGRARTRLPLEVHHSGAVRKK